MSDARVTRPRRPRRGLLDKPQILAAWLAGRWTVETPAGRYVGSYATHAEAVNAALDEPVARIIIDGPLPLEERPLWRQRTREAIARRVAEGQPVPAATIELAASWPPDDDAPTIGGDGPDLEPALGGRVTRA